jgi:hypothetical protein
MARKNWISLSQVFHCHTNCYAVRWPTKTGLFFLSCPTVTQIATQKDGLKKLSIFLRCPTVTQIEIQEDDQQKLLQSIFLRCHTGVTLSHKLECSKIASNNTSINLTQVSHGYTNCYAVRRVAKSAFFFFSCPTVTQIAMQWDGQQTMLQSFSGVPLSHKLLRSKIT